MSLVVNTSFLLQQRSDAFKKIRTFFEKRDFLEVDCPSLLKFPSIDTNIDLMEVLLSDKEVGYLHSSPEYSMKKLLATGLEKIYQIAHVYRKNEKGMLHNPEFTMIEWYQAHIGYEEFIVEVLKFLALIFKKGQVIYFSYQELFEKFLKINPFTVGITDLKKMLSSYQIVNHQELDKDDCLQLLLSLKIEPQFKEYEWIVLENFPESQAALAKVVGINGFKIAKRFEIYYRQIEIANGYLELNDSHLLRKRLEKENQRRAKNNKKIYPIDPAFLSAIDHLPDCMGVSVGFDRLFMLLMNQKSLQDCLPFHWNHL